MRIERDLMRGAGPLAVLKLLERGEMYGWELLEALESRSDGVLSMGQSTLYPMLYNLESKGLVAGAWRAADGGRKRRYYTLTTKGRRHLAAEQKQWARLVSALTALEVVSSGEGRRAVDAKEAIA